MPRFLRAARLLCALALAVGLWSACGREEFERGGGPPPPTGPQFPIGSGRDGSPTISTTVTLNECHAVIFGSGTQLSLVEVSAYMPDRLLLVIQMQELITTNSGAALVTTGITDAGRFEIAHLTTVAGAVLTVGTSLTRTYATGSAGAATAQVCSLPEFESLTVLAGGRVTAEPWTGSRGGVTAFLVRDTLTLSSGGVIDASGAGFLGGQKRPSQDQQDVFGLVTTNAGESGGKGEGLDGRSDQYSGRAPAANAGGGGNAHNAGGGGGGNGGRGGKGGREPVAKNDNPLTAGLGGTPIGISTASLRLLHGGGGGAGQQNDNHAGAGGAGGGVVLVFAGKTAGAGQVASIGASGLFGDDDGGGGGGAGGTVVFWAITSGGFAGTIDVRGGDGGSLSQVNGPGGGGGGGRVWLRDGIPALLVGSGGLPGNTMNPTDPFHGATHGSAGVFTPL